MPIVTVSQLNNYMKRYVERNANLSDLWVCGEISNFKQHYSGHIYMSLKDDYSVLRAVMFCEYAQKVKFPLSNGMRVIAMGRVAVYERDGSYQLYVEKIIPDGKGELYAAYEQLKNKLESQGLFDAASKKTIPPMPSKIGIVTSLSGAAIRDILSVAGRRFPLAELCIYPAKVQGIGSAESVCNGIKYLDKNSDCDVIIIARGGGSIEDLWAFNEEKTALAIFNCSKPLISAVGHETDFTIADFVADKRAPTPSAAAELALPECNELRQHILASVKAMKYSIIRKISSMQMLLNECSINQMYLKETEFCNNRIMRVTNIQNAITDKILTTHTDKLSHLTAAQASLKSLNPLEVLKRGYSVITDSHCNFVSPDKLSENDIINVRFNGGTLECSVRRIIYEE